MRVLLVECDMRNRTLAGMLNVRAHVRPVLRALPMRCFP